MNHSRARGQAAGRAPESEGALDLGLVVAAYGRHCLVESPDGQRRICHPRGKKSQAVVGDRVRWMPTGDEGSIERVETRRNLFYRQDELRTKSFAANLDQVLLLLAAEPEFSESQLARSMVAAEAEGIPTLIVVNKADLGTAFDHAWQRLAAYRDMGATVLPLRLKGEGGSNPGLDALLERLKGKTTLVLGPSGVGKSTLVNRLVPQAQALTGEIWRGRNSGKHSTTSTTWDGGEGTGVIAGGGVRDVHEAVGMSDVLTKSKGSNNLLNVAMATIVALEMLRSPEQLAAMRGKPVEQMRPFWERPRRDTEKTTNG